jgi:hypothetical protein
MTSFSPDKTVIACFKSLDGRRKTMKTKSLSFSVMAFSLILSACSTFTIIPSSDQPPTPVIVSGAAEEPTGSISGWVWHDQCETGLDGEPAPTNTPPGCVEQLSPLGAYHANGVLDTDELSIEGIVVKLRQGDCSATSLTQILAEMTTLASDLSYSFTGLEAGTYCVSIDPQAEPNFSLLRPGLWTYPVLTEGIVGTTVTLHTGENKFDVNFGWDHQFK